MRYVLVTATGFPRWKGDTDSIYIYDLSRRLAEKGFRESLLAPHHPGAKKLEKVDGITIYRFPYFLEKFQKLAYEGGILENIRKSWLARIQVPFFVLFDFLATRRVVKKENPDIIHAHWILPQGFIAYLMKRFYKTPYIVTAHAGDIFPLKSGLLKWFAGKAIDNARFCTANSEYTGQAIRKISPKTNVLVIPMGVDLSDFSPKKKSAKLRKELNGDPIILSVGRLAEKKGLKYLLLAMPDVIKSFPKAKLVIIGYGPLRQGLENLAAKLNLKRNVVFLGEKKHKELPAHYASADIFVAPSIVTKSGDTEGLGVVLLESLASGTPVVGSNVGGIPDIIKHNKTGLLVEQKNPGQLANAMIRMLSDKKLRAGTVRNSTALLQKSFSWEVIADRFAKILK